MRKNYEMDMTTGELMPKIITFALPLIAASVLQLLFNAADIVVVGRFVSPQAMAAVGSTESLVSLIIQLFVGFSIGVNVCVGRYYVAQRTRELSETVHTSVLVSILLGILLSVVGILVARPMLELMGSPADVIEDSALYLRIYFLGMPLIMLYDFAAAILRAVGDTKRPLYFQLLAGVVNVFLNLFFVLVVGIGVAGVAIATTLSQAISALALLGTLMREPGALHLDLRKLRISWKRFRSIVEIGLPAGLQSTVFNLSNVVIQSSINAFGSIAMAGSTAAQNIEGFVYISMNSIYQTDLSFTAQNLGAGKYSRINRILKDCLLTVSLIGLVMGIGAVLLDPWLLRFFTEDPEVVRYGQERLLVVCAPYFLCGIMDVMVGSLRGLGYSVFPMIVSLIGACGLRILFVLTLFRLPFFHRLSWLYMSYPITWTLTFTAHLLTFLHVRRKFPTTDEDQAIG